MVGLDVCSRFRVGLDVWSGFRVALDVWSEFRVKVRVKVSGTSSVDIFTMYEKTSLPSIDSTLYDI